MTNYEKVDDRFGEPEIGQSVACIRCDKILHNIDLCPEARNHPNDAVCFSSYGQYGTRVFDPGDGSRLEINLCDECTLSFAKTHIVRFAPEVNLSHDPIDQERLQSLRNKVKQAVRHFVDEKS